MMKNKNYYMVQIPQVLPASVDCFHSFKEMEEYFGKTQKGGRLLNLSDYIDTKVREEITKLGIKTEDEWENEDDENAYYSEYHKRETAWKKNLEDDRFALQAYIEWTQYGNAFSAICFGKDEALAMVDHLLTGQNYGKCGSIQAGQQLRDLIIKEEGLCDVD